MPLYLFTLTLAIHFPSHYRYVLTELTYRHAECKINQDPNLQRTRMMQQLCQDCADCLVLEVEPICSGRKSMHVDERCAVTSKSFVPS